MSYRPSIKNNENGTTVDLPLDAETVKGVDVVNTKQNNLTTSSVNDGTIDKAIGFDSQGNLVKGTVSGGMTNPMTTQGDIIYGGTSGTPTRLAKGSAGQVLAMNSGATAPEWKAVDTTPTSSSSNLITSGAVYAAIIGAINNNY